MWNWESSITVTLTSSSFSALHVVFPAEPLVVSIFGDKSNSHVLLTTLVYFPMLSAKKHTCMWWNVVWHGCVTTNNLLIFIYLRFRPLISTILTHTIIIYFCVLLQRSVGLFLYTVLLILFYYLLLFLTIFLLWYCSSFLILNCQVLCRRHLLDRLTLFAAERGSPRLDKKKQPWRWGRSCWFHPRDIW